MKPCHPLLRRLWRVALWLFALAVLALLARAAQAIEWREVVAALAAYDIATLVDGVLPAGRSTTRWDGRDSGGRSVASGVYSYRLTVEGSAPLSRKMVLLK